MKKLFPLAAALVAALGVFAGTAAADNSPLGGANNMTNTNASFGMFSEAMTLTGGHNAVQGDNGMFCAVFVSNGVLAPGTCNGTTPLP